MLPLRFALRRLVWAALLIPGLPLAGQSRTSSAIRGTVAQESGAPVVGAEVVVRNVGTGAERAALTNENGAFLVLLLQPGGPYTVTIRSLGLAEYRRAGVTLPVGETTAMEVVLRTEAVELEGLDVEVDRAAVFDRDLVGPTTRLSEERLESTPLISRDVMELALLSPLVKPTESGGFSIAGQNDRYNAILIDGVLNKDVFGLTSGGVPGGQAGAKLIPLDAVSQYEVLVAPFDVRLSGFTGGVMNAVTRTGTNDWRVRASAVHRAEALMGDLELITGPVEASGVDRSLLALSVGGPIAQDRAHFFVAGEFEERNQLPVGYNLFRDDPSLIRISTDRITELQELFEGATGLETGTAEAYPLGRTLSNVFARVDWNLARGHRLTARNVFARASNDETPNRTGFDPYGLSSNALFRTSTSNTTSLQLFSDVSGWGSNELEVSVAQSTDDTRAAADWPQVEVELISSVDGSSYQRSVRLGGNFFGQENHLSQTAFRVTNTLDIPRGDDGVLTLGVTGSYLDMAHAYLPGARGEYIYEGLTALQNDTPARYQRGLLVDGASPEVTFQAAEWGAFIQNQMRPGKGLSLRVGLRVDVPYVLSAPPENVDVVDYFGYSTSNLPSGNFLISPRWGVNWQSGGEHRTQVRAGGGMFAGQTPYVWLADAFHNDGSRSTTQVCIGDAAPGFGTPAPSQGCAMQRNVVVFESGFRFPQDLKFSLGVDHEFSDGLNGSLGALFSKALNQVAVQELNIEPGGSPAPGYSALGSRRFYSDRDAPFRHVFLVTNEGEDFGASVTAELRGTLGPLLRFQFAYALARSWDRMSLVFADMTSNLGLNPNTESINKPPLTTSNFDRPHKIVASLFGAPIPGLAETEISLLYTGQSGLPFTYVYDFDVNGDGFPGNGPSTDRYNDPVWVPEEAGSLSGTIATQVLTAGALRADNCLAEHRGRVIGRNGCRSPFQHRLDLRVAQTIRWGASEIRLEGDLINVLNLLNGRWGTVQQVRPQIPLYELCDCGPPATSPLLKWGGGVLPRRTDDGALRPSTAWSPAAPASQWQIQLGARVTFGR